MGGRRHWQVQFPDGPSWISEGQLQEIADANEDPLELLVRGNFGRIRDLRGNLTHVRLSGRLADLIYSMNTTNTDFYPYQFKPVLNFLDSPSNGLLVADEVGLGKTIEAGLIWTELRSRFDARKLVVLCPAMLREKWQSELRYRFGIDAEIVDARAMLIRLQELRGGKRRQSHMIGSLQGLRPNRGWDQDEALSNGSVLLARYLEDARYDEPLLDLVIIDEAHYLRNPESMTSRLGWLFRRVSEHIVLLSATPIHLRSGDLYQLLNLVDEDTFNRPEIFDEILAANEPVLRARDAVLSKVLTRDEFVDFLTTARRHRFMQGNRQLDSLVKPPPSDAELSDGETRAQLGARLERANLLGRAVTRTRKRDVSELRVVREAVPERIDLTDEERTFYEKVTEIVRDLAERRAAHEGFLLVTPQRQMSSSMPAALRTWRERGEYVTESWYEDIGDADEPTEGPGPIVRELSNRAAELGDLGELWRNDSKYQRLVAALRVYFSENPSEKVVLFAYFRPTLFYLQERLEKDGIDTLVLVGGTKDKDETIAEFRERPGKTVLLSSEVASEGVDLQFSRVIINYDLPWNPMKVEQRIGRIDRIGQESPKITVWNLFYKDTIDERIYDRLYTRLGIFERALGGLEAVLGDEMRRLTMDLLTDRLTAQQERDRIDQSAQAVANLKDQEDRLEEQAQNLVAHGDYILNQIKAAQDLNRFISGQDLFSYVRDYFEEHYKGSSFRQLQSDELVFDISLSSNAQRDLSSYLTQNRLQGTTELGRPSASGIRCKFENRVGRSTGRLETISQFHPLIRFVSSRLRQEDEAFYPLVSAQVSGGVVPDISQGTYVCLVRRWSVGGLRDIERLFFVARDHQQSGALLTDEDAERLVTSTALHGADWPGAKNTIDLHNARANAESCLEHAERCYSEYERRIDAENQDRADLQRDALIRHRDSQLRRLRDVAELHRRKKREGLVKATEGKIAMLERRVEQKLSEIEERRNLTRQDHEVCLALIQVQ